MRILVTRPQEDGAEIAERLAQMGHVALLAPLLTPHFEPGPEPDFAGIQAILITSANGVRALIRRTARRDLPVFAVGPQTAREAEAAGFTQVRDADGDARLLAAATARWTTPDQGALMHVCGAEAPGTLATLLEAAGFTVRRAVLYRVDAAPSLPGEARQALEAGEVDGALFFSPRSAKIFCDLTGGLPTEGLIALCISPVTAQALTRSFRSVQVAEKPNQQSLLALLN